MQLKKTEHASSSESSDSYLMRSVPHTFSIRLNNPHIYRPPPCSRRGRLRQLVHFGKVSRCSLIMVTNINQIKAVTATVGRHRNEQCGFQRLNGSTARGSSYHGLSCVSLSRRALVNSALGRWIFMFSFQNFLFFLKLFFFPCTL